jgi:hypothetical protein
MQNGRLLKVAKTDADFPGTVPEEFAVHANRGVRLSNCSARDGSLSALPTPVRRNTHSSVAGTVGFKPALK